jgi:hypothetical protein
MARRAMKYYMFKLVITLKLIRITDRKRNLGRPMKRRKDSVL